MLTDMPLSLDLSKEKELTFQNATPSAVTQPTESAVAILGPTEAINVNKNGEPSHSCNGNSQLCST